MTPFGSAAAAYTQVPAQLDCVILDPVGLLLLRDADQAAPAGHGNTSRLQADNDIVIPPKLMRRMMLSGVWQTYERGQLPSFQNAVQQLAELPFVKGWAAPAAASVEAIARSILRHRITLLKEAPAMAPLLDLLLHEVQAQRLVCAINASRDEIRMLTSKFPTLFAKFDTIVTSGEEGAYKSSQRFMHIALRKAGIRNPRHVLLLDALHDMQTIVAARSVGMHAHFIQPLLHLINSKNSQPSQYPLAIRISLRDNSSTGLHQGYSPPLPAPLLLPATPKSYLQHTNMETSTSLRESDTSTFTTTVCNRNQLSLTRKFLFNNTRKQEGGYLHFPSLTSEGIWIWDDFAQFLMADLLDEAQFLPMQCPPANGLLYFVDARNRFANLPNKNKMDGFLPTAHSTHPTALDVSTLKDIPQDLDATAIGLSVLHKFGKVSMDTINKVLDKMLEFVSEDDGILQVYFDAERPRIDPVVVANAIYLFHLGDRGGEVKESERFVQSVLEHRAYEDGTLYYSYGEAFLVHMARLVNRFEDHFTRTGMKSLLAARLQEQYTRVPSRIDRSGGDSLRLAMRMQACTLCGLGVDEREAQELLQLQRGDGSWDCHPYYRYGSNVQSWIGNEGVTTAYCLAALSSTRV